MPRPTIDDLLWSVYHEARDALRDLERADTECGSNILAARYIAIIAKHVEPLRRAVEAVELHERADAEAETVGLSRLGPL